MSDNGAWGVFDRLNWLLYPYHMETNSNNIIHHNALVHITIRAISTVTCTGISGGCQDIFLGYSYYS